ncbi:hypothetical protein GLAREA_03539 [Glarea lozoyensis ATCC 20868]|uniref:Uncharacterized protein n=1 Tax=Glarea lozoyensis (strain ATCC 20868 / MF5171) TaxID=1116229 RepID=S3CVY0_GLAL2|nr:uncharacterized protein GLAREA_03539 [Glarea lozoyensis ATCC 20868]EPE30572.1 hypothetical protein GLAREA_03539 [Glarea lozoyensis ATCC 20868]
MRHQIVPGIQMRGLLIAVMVMNGLPVAAAGQDGPADVRAFEAPAFEDYGATVAVPAVADVVEGFHFAFEVEQELEGGGGEGIVWFSPCEKVRNWSDKMAG